MAGLATEIMSAQTDGSESPDPARQGPARNRSGRRTAARIVTTACDILRTEGYERLSMQGIAKRLGIRLSNVQYYFKSRGDLIKAMMDHVQETYVRRYREVLDQAGDSPEARFRAVLDFNFEDIGDDDTRHFFIQLWPLLSTADNYSGALMKQLYESQLIHLSDRILELFPDITPDEARIRAEILAALIEGLMVTVPANVDTPGHRKQLKDSIVKTAFAVARGRQQE